ALVEPADRAAQGPQRLVLARGVSLALRGLGVGHHRDLAILLAVTVVGHEPARHPSESRLEKDAPVAPHFTPPLRRFISRDTTARACTTRRLTFVSTRGSPSSIAMRI